MPKGYSKNGINNGQFKTGHTYKMSEETKLKISAANKGKTYSEEHKAKLSRIHKLKPNRYWLGKKLPPEVIEKIRNSRTGKKIKAKSIEGKENMKKAWIAMKLRGVKPPSHKGYKHSLEARIRMSISKTGKMRGASSPHWKGGATEINKAIRTSLKYKQWRSEVFFRDKWTCVQCGYKGNELQADHIKPFAYYPDLRFEVSNGRTLCRACHLQTDTYAWRAKRTFKNLVSNK